jgi:hypothetical protein
MTAIMAIMKDENGDAIMLQQYQQEDEDTCAAADIVDVGTLLLVKEPYIKFLSRRFHHSSVTLGSFCTVAP